MTIVVDWDIKQQNKQTHNAWNLFPNSDQISLYPQQDILLAAPS